MNSDAPSGHLSPDQWPTRDRAFVEELQLIGWPSSTRSVEGRAGLVTTTSSPIAAYAGINVLRAGGTAADAAATIALTQATTALGSYVSHAGIVQALYYEARSGKIQALNAGWNTCRHETDPESIPACDLLFGGVGIGVGFGEPPAATAHGRKTLVPGFMAGIEALHTRFGRLPFSDLFVPAIWYAENGLAVGPALAWFFETRGKHLARTPEGQQFMRQSGRERPQAGDRFVQAELANTLRAVAKEGSRHMYGGAWGRQFVDMVQREGGKVTIEDMESYEAIWEEPLETDFLDHRVVVAGPSSLGGRQVLQALNLIEQLALHRMGPYWQDERAFRDLSRVLGFVVSQDRPEVIDALTRKDVDFSAAARLTKTYAQAVAPLIPELGSGTPPEAPAHSDAIVVVDRWGNIASVTHTINTILWGDTGMVVGGVPLADCAGYMQGALASLVPGARVPSGNATTITLTNGKPHLATAPVGSALIAETVRILLGILGNRLEPQTIRAAPPLLFDFAGWNRFAIPEGKYAPEFVSRLERLGERVRTVPNAEVQSTRGSVVLGAVDANSSQWLGFETSNVLGFAFGEPPVDDAPVREVTIDPTVCDGLVGHYRLRPGYVVTITREKDRLFAQLTGQPKLELFARSGRDYFYKTIDAQITFETDLSGHAARLVRRRHGRDTVGQRVDDEEASRIEQPQAVDSKLLASYVGRYRLAPKSIFSLMQAGDRLFAQGKDQVKFELFAESDHVFYARTSEAHITFEPDVGGKPRTLIVHLNGRDERGERLDASEETVVMLLNDEQTPMEFVIWLLEGVFGKTHEEAVEIMLVTRRDGRGVCGVYTHEDADRLVEQVMELAREHGHPLQCVRE
jgi:gamma-glutamyltranspeptidase/glutathione hydrolase